MNNRIVDSKLRFPKFKNKWEFIKFKKYIKLYRGSSPRPIHEYLSYGDGVNWIKIGDTKNCVNYIISSTEEKITYAGAEKSRYVNSGELILANSMTYGKAYLLEISGCIYDGWFVLRDYEQYFDKRFLLYQLNSDILQKQYQKLSAGGIVLNISSDIVYQTNIFHTSIEEQQKIAECLNSIDELIAGEEDKLKELKNHKKGLLQKLFPKNNSSNPELRFPEFKEDWQSIKLKDISIYQNGTSYENQIDDKGNFYLITLNSLDIEGNLKQEHKKIKTPEWVLNKDDLVMVLSDVAHGNFLGLTDIIPENDKYVLNQRMALLRIKKDYNVKFIRYYINHNQQYFKSVGQGSSQKNLAKDAILNFDILNPSKKEQDKISECLSSISDMISAQTEKIEALKLHKKGLMQGLFPSLEEVKDEQ